MLHLADCSQLPEDFHFIYRDTGILYLNVLQQIKKRQIRLIETVLFTSLIPKLKSSTMILQRNLCTGSNKILFSMSTTQGALCILRDQLFGSPSWIVESEELDSKTMIMFNFQVEQLCML